MNLETKHIGFIGIDKYDIMLLLSSILSCSNKKILLVDLSESKALTMSVQKPDGFKASIFSTRIPGVDFLNGNYLPDKNEYDFIFFDFGYNANHPYMDKCLHYIIVTDQQLHNIKRLCNLSLFKTENAIIMLLSIDYKINYKYISEQLNVTENDRIHAVYEESVINRIKLDCQYTNRVSMKDASRGYKNMLFDILHLILDGENLDIKKLYRLSERRR